MISRRSLFVAALLTVPVVVYAGLGLWALWQQGLIWWNWWVAPVCWGIAAWLANRWRIGAATLPPLEPLSVNHFTPRDQEAAKIVDQCYLRAEQFTVEQLSSPQVYVDEARHLATELARHYYPLAVNPYDSITVAEFVAALRLALDDLEQKVLPSLPLTQSVSIGQWQALQKLPGWLDRANLLLWGTSIVADPTTLVKYTVSEVTSGPVTNKIWAEVILSLHRQFLRYLGTYLIEMYSGRLRRGADVYRKSFPLAGYATAATAMQTQSVAESGRKPSNDASQTASGHALPEAQPVTIVLTGQVSSGKSSLVNALTASEQAAVDVLPLTDSVQRYQLALGSSQTVVTLLDTPGYGDTGLTDAGWNQLIATLREADAVLLVFDAHSPAKEADRKLVEALKSWCQRHPELKPPPIIGVLTHIDLLRPIREWSPPYNWREPKTPKETSIQSAVQYHQELLGSVSSHVVPVGLVDHPNGPWGVVEELVPTICGQLRDAQAVALLRTFEKSLDSNRWKYVRDQTIRLGTQLFRSWIDRQIAKSPRSESPGS